MPRYSARVEVAQRTGKTVDKASPPWTMAEVLVDHIRASSQRNAKKKAIEQAVGFTEAQFPPDERDSLPSPVLVAISRLKADGTPVASTFSLEACVKIAGDAEFKLERKTSIKKKVKNVTAIPLGMRVVLADPFTDDIISLALESNDNDDAAKE